MGAETFESFPSLADRSFVTMPQKFPEVQGGGSLILAWQIKGKHVLVIGGGEVRNHLTGAFSPYIYGR